MTTTTTRTMVRARTLVATIAALALVAMAAPAHAHTSLLGSSPGPGETVGSLEVISLEFNEELLDIGAQISIVDEAGNETELEPYGAEPRFIEAEVPPLPGGDYAVQWRVVSLDGHPVSGEILFSIDGPAVAPEGTVEPDVAAPSPDPTPADPSPTPSPTPSPMPDEGDAWGGDLSPGTVALIALVAALLVTLAWLLTRAIGAKREDALES